ncbi:hypothetical protein GCM10011352_02490 [Marinobacterium zhoushanense]|uniref:Dicarboxylate transport domain-containing protein n=1 Tax=Marinobacterium zhoushanense TaxID=1679163 RepID=A0ABQ1JZG3_9GAMM|nr:YdbH domain-containing protein [Marinobacterium zhoushanense]GGB80296.1 hypothetical protein GCM10011352_02490 [Marinobacterium zhoushanense]
MRKLLWLLLPVPLLLLLLYIALPYVARSLIEQWLSDQGFHTPRIELTHPGWSSLEIPSLSLSQRGDERQINLQASDISILFDPGRLLLNREISEIRIPRVQIEITAERSIEARIETSAAENFDLNQVPPTLLFQYAPARRLVIGEAQIDYQAPDQPSLNARGNIDLTREQLLSRMQLDITPQQQETLAPVYLDLRLQSDQQLSLALLRNNMLMAQVSGKLNTEGSTWGAALSSNIELIPLQQWLQSLLPNYPVALTEGRLDAQLTTHWPAQLPLDGTQLIQALSAELSSNLSLRSGALSIDEIEAEHGDLELTAHASLSASELQLRVLPGSSVGGKAVHAPGWAVQDIRLRLERPFELVHSLDGARTEPGPIQLVVTPEGMELDGVDSLSLSPLEVGLQIQPVPLGVEFRLNSKKLDLAVAGKQLPSIATQLSGQWHPDTARGTLRLQTQTPETELNADWRLSATDFHADWRASPLNLPSLQPLLRQWLAAWPSDLVLNRGELRLSGQLTGPSPGDAAVSAAVALRSTDLTWADHIEAEGVDADLDVQYRRNGSLSSGGVVHADLLRTGIDIRDTQLAYRYRQNRDGSAQMTTQPLTLNLLGGRIELPAITFDPTAPSFETTATLEQIQLSEALRLYQQPGLTGETALSGTLPIRIKGQDIEISNGHISSTTPGWIRYQPSTELELAAQSNPGLQLALSALSNLQLDQLDLGVHYTPNGDLELNSRLQGQNPDWQQGRPIDITLNIEENLLQLLRSLQISQRIGESLQKQLTR